MRLSRRDLLKTTAALAAVGGVGVAFAAESAEAMLPAGDIGQAAHLHRRQPADRQPEDVRRAE